MEEKKRRYSFPPGKSGNPKGKPKYCDEPKIKELTDAEFRRICNGFLYIDLPGLKQKLEDKEKPPTTLEAMIGTRIIKAIHQNDHRTLQFFLERLVGKPKQVFQIQGDKDNPITMTYREARKIRDEVLGDLKKLQYLEDEDE